MDNLIPLFVGISSSLVATALWFSAVFMLRAHILPWYANQIYRGVRIDGTWTVSGYARTKVPPGTNSVFEFSLFQKAENVTGTVTIQLSPDKERTYFSVQGIVRDAHFSALLKPKSPRLVDAGTCLFRIFNEAGHLRMIGSITTSGARDPGIEAMPIEIVESGS